MIKVLDKYKIFNIIELSLLGLSITADAIAVFTLNFKDKLIVPVIGASLFFCTAVGVKYLKLRDIKDNILTNVTHSIHEIDHHLRNEFYKMFDTKKKNQMDTDSIENYINRCGDIVSRNLSNGIYKMVGSKIRVIVKLFEFDSEKSEIIHSCAEKDIINSCLEKIKMRSIGKSVNGNQIELTSDSYFLTENTLYVEALKVIVEDDKFLYSDTRDLLKDYKKRYQKRVFNYPRNDWFIEDKGVIIVPISDEKHTWYTTGSSESQIIGLIKIVSDSYSTFNQENIQKAIIMMAQAAADSLYKCIDRQKYYFSLVVGKEGAA